MTTTSRRYPATDYRYAGPGGPKNARRAVQVRRATYAPWPNERPATMGERAAFAIRVVALGIAAAVILLALPLVAAIIYAAFGWDPMAGLR